jgi:hypothetical protein
MGKLKMSDDSCNTTAESAPTASVPESGGCTGKGFVAGDARINRRGRPRLFDECRDVAQKILRERVYIEGSTAPSMQRIELILRQWAASRKAADQKQLVEIGYGKVPDKLEVTGENGEKFQVTVERVDAAPTEKKS